MSLLPHLPYLAVQDEKNESPVIVAELIKWGVLTRDEVSAPHFSLSWWKDRNSSRFTTLRDLQQIRQRSSQSHAQFTEQVEAYFAVRINDVFYTIRNTSIRSDYDIEPAALDAFKKKVKLVSDYAGFAQGDSTSATKESTRRRLTKPFIGLATKALSSPAQQEYIRQIFQDLNYDSANPDLLFALSSVISDYSDDVGWSKVRFSYTDSIFAANYLRRKICLVNGEDYPTYPGTTDFDSYDQTWLEKLTEPSKDEAPGRETDLLDMAVIGCVTSGFAIMAIASLWPVIISIVSSAVLYAVIAFLAILALVAIVVLGQHYWAKTYRRKTPSMPQVEPVIQLSAQDKLKQINEVVPIPEWLAILRDIQGLPENEVRNVHVAINSMFTVFEAYDKARASQKQEFLKHLANTVTQLKPVAANYQDMIKAPSIDRVLQEQMFLASKFPEAKQVA